MSKLARDDAGHQPGMLAGRPLQQRPSEFVTVPPGDSYKFQIRFGALHAIAPPPGTWRVQRRRVSVAWSTHLHSSALSSTQPGAT